jgi:hypothetical protein
MAHCTAKHKCDKASSLCTATPPFTKDQSVYCDTCNSRFLSVKCFQNDLTHKVKGKLICQWRQVCRYCSFAVTGDSKHENFKRFCNYCNKKQHSDQFCYVALLKPSKLTDRFLFVFFDTECTQDIEKHHGSFAPHMCSVDVFKVRSGGWPEWRL